jgi:hypothetical protein
MSSTDYDHADPMDNHKHHMHEIPVVEIMMQGMRQHIDMLTLNDRICRKALLKLLPNVGDKVDVDLNPGFSDEALMNDDSTEYLTKVTIVRIEDDTLDLLLG